MQPSPTASLDPPADPRPSLVVVRTVAHRKADVLRYRRNLSILSHGLVAFLAFAVGMTVAVQLYGSALAHRIVCGGAG